MVATTFDGASPLLNTRKAKALRSHVSFRSPQQRFCSAIPRNIADRMELMIYYLIKFTLLITIFFCTAQFGVRLAANEREGLRRLEGLLELICHIKREIEYYSIPLSEIYQSFSCKELDDCGFLSLLKKTADDGESDDKTAFCRVLELSGKQIPMSDSLYSAVYEFGVSLGRCVAEDQIRRCDAVIECIEAECKKLREELPKRAKLQTTLSLSTGMMLVILLL